MPKVKCDQFECRFNTDGVCYHDEIDLDYEGVCQSFEEKKEE
jgi:hypothetical protein